MSRPREWEEEFAADYSGLCKTSFISSATVPFGTNQRRETMEGKAIGGGYGVAGNQGYANNMQVATDAPARATTRMEDLGERLGSNLGTLAEVNSRLESALDRFHHAPTALQGANPNKEPTPPPSGTMAYIDHLTNKTNEELSRLNDLVNRVRTIF